VGNWLVERFTLFGVTFQSWLMVARAIILIGLLIAWWRQQ
jgi:cell division protein FtsX